MAEKTTRYYSDLQEKHIAKKTAGRVTVNSGGTKFGGGDVIAEPFFVEAKTVMTPKKSFSVKKEWLNKAKEQAFEQGLTKPVLAFQFEPAGDNYYVLDEQQFLEYLTMVRREEDLL